MTEALTWKASWNNSRFRFSFLITFLVLVCIAISINYFFVFIQNRPGYEFHDPVLNAFTPYPLSVYTFILIYGAIIFALLNIANKPLILLRALQALAILMMIRMLILYFVPLEAPKTMIPLQDPFIEKFFYGQTRITKDLFFSGHVSILCLTVFALPKLRWLFISLTIMVAFLILLQHVHYSIDVIAAPFFSWISYKLAERITFVLRPKS
jgi:hypothetical protein